MYGVGLSTSAAAGAFTPAVAVAGAAWAGAWTASRPVARARRAVRRLFTSDPSLSDRAGTRTRPGRGSGAAPGGGTAGGSRTGPWPDACDLVGRILERLRAAVNNNS